MNALTHSRLLNKKCTFPVKDVYIPVPHMLL